MITSGGRLLANGLVDPDTYTVATTSDSLESELEYMSKFPVDGPEFPTVLFAHMLGGTRGIMNSDTHPFKYISDYLASLGFYCIIGSCGNHYGNDTFRGQCDELIAHAESAGAAVDQVILVGVSQGGLLVSWAADGNMDKVITYAGLAPITDMSNFYDRANSDGKTEIDAAHGGSWENAATTYDPYLLAQAGALDGLKGKIWYGASDGICRPEDAEALLAELPLVRGREIPGDHFSTIAGTLFNWFPIALHIASQYRPLGMQRVLLGAS